MLKIAIIDDEIEFLKYLDTKLKYVFSKKNIKIKTYMFTDGEQMTESLLSGKSYYDVFFLDVQMPNKKGMEIAKIIRSKYQDVLIVFVTSFDNYVFEAFDYDAVAYVRKNEFDDKIENAVDRIISKFNMNSREFIFNNSEGQYHLSPKNIMYFESLNHSIYIYDKNDRVIKITNSLNQLEQDFSIYNFIRIHSGYLVNLKYVYSIENISVVLSNNKVLPVSRHRMKEVKRAFHENLRGV